MQNQCYLALRISKGSAVSDYINDATVLEEGNELKSFCFLFYQVIENTQERHSSLNQCHNLSVMLIKHGIQIFVHLACFKKVGRKSLYTEQILIILDI